MFVFCLLFVLCMGCPDCSCIALDGILFGQDRTEVMDGFSDLACCLRPRCLWSYGVELWCHLAVAFPPLSLFVAPDFSLASADAGTEQCSWLTGREAVWNGEDLSAAEPWPYNRLHRYTFHGSLWRRHYLWVTGLLLLWPLSERPPAALAIEWEACHWVRGLLLLWPLSERPSAALAIEWEASCCSGHWVRGLLLLWPLSERPPAALAIEWEASCCSGHWVRGLLLFWPLSERPSAALAIEWEASCCSGHWVRGLLLLWPLSERPPAALAIEWEASCCSGHWVRGLLLLWPLSERPPAALAIEGPPVVLDHCTGSLCWVNGECCSWLRVVLIAKLGLDIAFGDAIRIRTASLYHHKQNDWMPIEVMALLAAASVSTGSAGKLGVISATALHSSPAVTASPVNEGGIWMMRK